MVQFGAIGMVADNMTETLAFYRLLGLDIPQSADSEQHVEAALPGGIRIMWDAVDVVHSIEPDWRTPTGGHRVALAFDCGSPAAVDEAYAEITAAGHQGKHQPWNAPWGQRYATVLDPDGVPVDLFATLTT